MENKVLVLGSSGYMGSFISKNIECVGLSRSDVDLTNFDALYTIIKKYKPDTIINCASNLDTSMDTFNFSAFYENLTIYNNIYKLKDEFRQLINFGSGAEFDRKCSINNAKEFCIYNRLPSDHYGLSKNIIARNILETENFYTLRLFGCFHSSESNDSLLKQVLSITDPYSKIINDRFFDYFWLPDILPVLEYYLNPHTIKMKDINLVYDEKILLSIFIKRFLVYHNIKKELIYEKTYQDYTGSSKNLSLLNIELGGLQKGIEEYLL